jgi:immunity protein 50 of polymorphic toxin system
VTIPSWHTFAENPQAVAALYREVPPLAGACLMSVSLRQDGGVLVVLKLPRYPDSPPKRWSPRSNAAVMELGFWEVSGFSIHEWRGIAAVDVTIARASTDSLEIMMNGVTTRLALRSSHMHIQGFSDYIESDA